jgi:hypothetical protein
MAPYVTSAETDWAKRHPVPESTASGDLLMLWNYPVAKSDLSTVHKNAIHRFLAPEWLEGPASSSAELTVHGHASDTGDSKLNEALARARAENVARFLRAQGVSSRLIFVSSAGAAEPVDSGSSGLALAKNRRVDVTKYTPALPEPPLPPLDLGGSPEPAPVPSPSGSVPTHSSTAIEVPISLPLQPIRTSEVFIDSRLEGTLKLRVDEKGRGWGGTAVLSGGKLTPKAEAEIFKNVMGKITFEPSSSGKPASLKVGAEKKDWLLAPEIGLQINPKFLYINLTLGEVPLPDVVLGDTHIAVKLVGKIKCEIGPGPAMLARAARAGVLVSDALAAVAPVAIYVGPIAGGVGVALLVMGGTAYAIQQAKEEGVRFSRLLAQRDGAGSRLALEIIGNDVRAAFAERKLQWSKVQISMEDDFNAGVRGVEAMLRKPEERSAKGAAWKVRFANDGTRDFTLIRERVFHAVGGYNNDASIGDALSAL